MNPIIYLCKRLATISILLNLAGCCAIVPWPHDSQHSPRFSGRVVAMNTQAPIVDARIAVDGFPKTTVITGSDGKFCVGPGLRWRWGYLWTPELIHDLPLDGVHGWSYAVVVTHPKYEGYIYSAKEQVQGSRIKGSVVDVGVLKLKPREERRSRSTERSTARIIRGRRVKLDDIQARFTRHFQWMACDLHVSQQNEEI